MPTENKTDPRKSFVPRYLPWLLAIVAFAVYCLTLQHWVSLYNLSYVAKVSGWDWRPQVYSPITFLVLLPFRLLPATVVPLALNFLSALCASLTLALLARSVALLPQDRTDAQRKREKNGFSFLTIPAAWLPPVLAVMVCGLQLTFWEQATNFSGEMLDLLLFAFVIWSLLEYRLDERESRLFLAAFIYGAGMAENWAMIGFFPLFFTAIIWIRGTGILDLRFVSRMMICGTVGLLLYLLLPLLAVTSSNIPTTFWEVLKLNLLPAHAVLKAIGTSILNPIQSLQYVSLVLAYLLPILVMAIRWSATFGDSSQIGSGIANVVLHIAQAFFLGVFIWMAFDPQFGPRNLGNGLSLLTFYYLGALAVGYFTGYFLLVFGKPEITKRPPRRTPPLQFLNKPIVIGVWALAAITIVGLIYRNVPLIKISNDDTLRQFAKLTEENLPKSGGYLLSDDVYRLFLVRAALAQDGRANEFVPLDTESLPVPAYHHYLHKQFQQRWPDLIPLSYTNSVHPAGLIQLLAMLSRTNDLYYLHPSFGYYFEQFYLEPHGLVYKLKTLPTDTLLPPLPDKDLIVENEDFWTHDAAPSVARVAAIVASPNPDAGLSEGEYLLLRLHISRQANQNAALFAGGYYSRSLDFWGVQLQRINKFDRAATNFEAALEVNPANVIAQINLNFNQKLQSRGAITVDPSRANTDQFGKSATWQQVLNANGPFDDPDFCFVYGIGLARDNGFTRQSIAQFERVRELAPDYLPARLLLAQTYISNHRPQDAMESLRAPLTNPGRFSLNETNETRLHFLAAAASFQESNSSNGIKFVDDEITHHPHEASVLAAAAQIFIVRGLFTNALTIINEQLESSPTNPAWLYAKGYTAIQLKDYPVAIANLTRVLEIETNNDNALFNRAIANLDGGHLDEARTDYLRIQSTYSNSVPVAYGLAEIDERQHDTNDAIRNYEIYLAHANTNSAEAKTVAERLKALKP
ncbi:MAG TPA: tetratricopeptide repeat protein [Verrucomicrobiae bacterium]|jgi:tetratricopeptide (TPR) repeat protein